MNGDTGWTERFNSTVRGIIALLLVGAYCWRFLTGHVDDSLFSNILAGVVGYWFAQKAAERMMDRFTPPTPAPGTTTETKTVTPPTTPATPPPPGGAP